MVEMKNRLLILGLILVIFSQQISCEEKVVKDVPGFFDREKVLKTLGDFKMDHDFGLALQELERQMLADQSLAEYYIKTVLGIIGISLVNPNVASQFVGGVDDLTRVKYLGSLSEKIKEGEGYDVIKDIEFILSGKSGRDLSKLFDLAMGETWVSPHVRLIIAKKVLNELVIASEAPEPERGNVFLSRFPSFPSPPTRFPHHTVFPSALSLLGNILEKGAGKELGLVPYMEKVKTDAIKAFEGKVFALPVNLEIEPKPSTPLSGIGGGYNPLVCAVLQNDGLFLGARPAIGFPNGRSVNRTARIGWPGALVAQIDELDESTDTLNNKIKEFLGSTFATTDAIEPIAYQNLKGQGILNLERKTDPKAILIGAVNDVLAYKLGNIMALLKNNGVGDFRFLTPGRPGFVMPVFYQKVIDVPGQEDVKKLRLIVALSSTGAECYPPPKMGEKLQITNWPEKAKVVQEQKKVFKVIVPWDMEKGFDRMLSSTLSMMRKSLGAGPFVEVVIRGKDIKTSIVLDAIAEIMASEGEPFKGISAYFRGLSCPQSGDCPTMIPILFSNVALPKQSKPEALIVKEERPAGFCDKKNVEGVMRSRAGAIRACYERELQRHGEMEGRVEVKFTVEVDGKLSNLTVTQNTTGSKSLEECIQRQLTNLVFAKPEGGICIVRWPFVFKPN